jgi:integrase
VPLFSLPLFQGYELPSAENSGRDAAYWVPVLCVLIGARITEMAQLLTADVFERGGLWIIAFRITDGSWQSLKGGAAGPSAQEILVNPELARLGFLDYCAAMRNAGHERLFPLAKVSGVNNVGGALSSWFSGLKTSAGWGKEDTFHSFRHGIETALKWAKEPKSHIGSNTGHGARDVADRHYTHLRAEDLMETAAKVTLHGVELPEVFPPPG